MTELDQALEKLMQDEEQQAQYYDLVLNTDFYIPICEPEAGESQESVAPLLLESDGKSYLMLFDTEERLTAWAKQTVPFAIIAGYQIAEFSTPELHWAVNIGGQFAKEFVPDEISFLKEATPQE